MYMLTSWRVRTPMFLMMPLQWWLSEGNIPLFQNSRKREKKIKKIKKQPLVGAGQ